MDVREICGAELECKIRIPRSSAEICVELNTNSFGKIRQSRRRNIEIVRDFALDGRHPIGSTRPCRNQDGIADSIRIYLIGIRIQQNSRLVRKTVNGEIPKTPCDERAGNRPRSRHKGSQENVVRPTLRRCDQGLSPKARRCVESSARDGRSASRCVQKQHQST